MRKNISLIIVPLAALAILFLIYRMIFVRVVNYEIGGIKIPSLYNAFTGKVKPIENYNGRTDLRTVETSRTDKVGLSEETVVAARLRWALFESWANAHPEYRGWDTDKEIFKKADQAFRDSIKK